MKKIVALVLSLVMVLGLATTAFAADLSGTYSIKSVNEQGDAFTWGPGVSISVTDAATIKDTDKDGLTSDETPGNVKFFSWAGRTFLQVGTVAEADYIVYYDNSTTVFGYFKMVDNDDVYYMGTGAAFTNFGEACGQLDAEPTAETKYYSFEGAVYEGVKATATTTNLMVGGEIVPVALVAAADAAAWVDHTVAYTYDKDYKVVGVKCAECGVVATIYANYASVAKADKADAVALGDGRYYVWTNAVEAPAGETVESAKTFDAGIAMYVGMSVMAAAGSAVVLKKKD